MKHKSFAAMILTHGRPDRIYTHASLRRSGYTGRIVFVLDDEDETVDAHREAFPEDDHIVFDKEAYAAATDSCTNSPSRCAIVFARNAAFDIAHDLGLETFVQLDDDYTAWHHRVGPGDKYLSSCEVRDLDGVFDAMLDFLYDTEATAVALAQGGDLLSGGDASLLRQMSRKAMNSWFCRTDRQFAFSGLMNEDVSAYTTHGARGALFATVGQVHLNQVQTQAAEGGMSAAYRDGGTYIKSFYTVLANPSCVSVALMGTVNPRLHHSINWNLAVPRIVSAQKQTKTR